MGLLRDLRDVALNREKKVARDATRRGMQECGARGRVGGRALYASSHLPWREGKRPALPISWSFLQPGLFSIHLIMGCISLFFGKDEA